MILKYLITYSNGNKTPILFNKNTFSHKDLSTNIGTVVSAGFCIVKVVNRHISVYCFGESSTLELECDSENDKYIIEKMFNQV